MSLLVLVMEHTQYTRLIYIHHHSVNTSWMNVSSPVRKWHDKVKMWFIRFIFLSVSVKDSENWRTHIRSYLSPIYSIYTLFLLFLFTEQGDAIFVQIKVQTKRYYKWQKNKKVSRWFFHFQTVNVYVPPQGEKHWGNICISQVKNSSNEYH